MKPNPNQIEQLIERYWLGQTTPEEEAQVLAHFSTAEAATGNEAAYFQAIDSLKNETVPAGFDEKLLAKLHPTASASVPSKKIRSMGALRVWGPRLAAAAVMILLGGWLLLVPFISRPTPADNTDRVKAERVELARQQALAALRFTSAKLQKGKKPLANLRLLRKSQLER